MAGCGAEIDRQPQIARPTEDTQKDFDDLEVHYNAIRTDQLTPEVARAYGIERSANRVLLNVAMLTKTPGGAAKPVDGTVSASAHNLNGQLKSLSMRRVQEGPAVYFIGEVGISGDEILVFNIDVEPVTGGGPTLGTVQARILRRLIRRNTKKIGKKQLQRINKPSFHGIFRGLTD